MTKAKMEIQADLSPIERLKWVMECLRDKENGCPWDIEQDFRSILKYTIEEAYEVADAIERNDMTDLREELGDLLLQVIYHTQMATEQDLFNFDDVTTDVAEKMISRHPHVFGDAKADTADDVNLIWDQQKDKEKNQDSALDGVTKGLPALLRAQKLQKKAAKTGFEWKNANDAFAKIEEEILEFKDACANSTKEHQEEEFGDILIALANYARMEGINAEEALRKANEKFIKRFQGMEKDFEAINMNLSDAPLDQMMDVWNQQKKKPTNI